MGRGIACNNNNNNNNNDLEVVHLQKGSSSTWFLVELEFGNVGFWGEGKTGVPREKTPFHWSCYFCICSWIHKEKLSYILEDGLAPKHEEDDSAIGQMLKKFHTKQDTGKTSSTAQQTDTCFRWQKLRHWAAECTEGHEPEWWQNRSAFIVVSMPQEKWQKTAFV